MLKKFIKNYYEQLNANHISSQVVKNNFFAKLANIIIKAKEIDSVCECIKWLSKNNNEF